MSVEGWAGAIHPAAELFPLIQGDDFEDLVADVAANGLLEPIWLTSDGALLDGRNRVRACHRTGTQVTTRTYEGSDPVGFVVSLNLKRRHLTTGQKAMLALEVESLIAVDNRPGRPWHEEVIVADLPQLPERERKSRERAAAVVGTSGRAVSQAKRVREAAPELAEQVAAGTMALNKAEALARNIEARKRAEETEHAALAQLLARLQQGETVVVNLRDDLSRAIEARGLLVRIDRGSPWGNPWILDEDGSRQDVINAYQGYYLPHKPSLLSRLDELRGKALGCWCAPLPCHGDVLVRALS